MLKIKNNINYFIFLPITRTQFKSRFYSQLESINASYTMFYVPNCSKCVHYNKQNERCKLFDKYYLFARFDEKKCGLDGKYFELE